MQRCSKTLSWGGDDVIMEDLIDVVPDDLLEMGRNKCTW